MMINREKVKQGRFICKLLICKMVHVFDLEAIVRPIIRLKVVTIRSINCISFNYRLTHTKPGPLAANRHIPRRLKKSHFKRGCEKAQNDRSNNGDLEW